ncbi:MAG: glycosyltransferase [Candidatus Hydrogenedentes bacterium]|nr:glycosyltransferase [Candidatus Hydrogenedentota bacterium]
MPPTAPSTASGSKAPTTARTSGRRPWCDSGAPAEPAHAGGTGERPVDIPGVRAQHGPHKLSILIPVFNEFPTLEGLLNRVLDAPLPCAREIVVVDDCSTDGSRALLEAFAAQHTDTVRLVLLDRNRGKGHAIRTAIEHMTGDWAVIQDADLEYDPADYATLLLPVQKGLADAVFGSRFVMGRYRRAMYFWHTVANKFLTLVTNLFSGLNLTDMETCYKLVRADILKNLDLRSRRFDIEPEITLKLARWGARIYEVPISYQGRTYEEGKKIGAKDAFMAFMALIRFTFFQRRFTTHAGFMALRALERAKSFNRWLYAQVDEWLGDEVLEAGCGIGNLTRLMLRKRRLVCIDLEPFYVDRVREAFGHLANLTVRQGDLSREDDLRAAAVDGPFDSVLAVNVLEHIEDDDAMLRALHGVLKPGGRAVILVPHDPALFTAVDKHLGHHRRYTRADLTGKLERAGFHVCKCSGFNRVGGLGWRISGKFLRQQTLSTGQLRWFELLMPVIRIAEHIPFHRHTSLIAIGEKSR